jgi:transporter family-2 protein
MTEQLFLIFVAAMGGVAVAVQAQLMGLMDRGIGTLESVCITYVGGAVIIGLILLALRGGNLGAWHHVPRYALGAGIVGLIIVGAIGYSVPRLGMVPAFSVLVASQFIFGAVIDHFGLFGATVRPLDLSSLMGIPILLLGTWLIIR